MQPTNISIGIPAHNEEHNIARLIESLKKQTGDFTINQIIVVADGCTDTTVARVRTVADSRLELVEFAVRRGLPAAQNEIVRRAQGDIVVLLNADVLPADAGCIHELISPLTKDTTVGIASAEIEAMEPVTTIERMIVFSQHLKTALFSRRSASHVYACHGRARAFSRALYRQIKWPAEYSEDAFSYFFARSRGFRCVSATAARVLFRAPQTLRDHVRQSVRFHRGRRAMKKYFGKPVVHKEYALSMPVITSVLWRFFWKNPIFCIGYCAVAVYAYSASLIIPQKADTSVFVVSPSSKKVLP